jgi:hypothetical protein
MTKSAKIFFATLILLLLIPIIYHVVRKYDRDKHARYTIGITRGESFANRTNHDIEFIYCILNKEYDNKNAYDFKSKSFNGRYFVLYDSINPKNSKLLQDFPVPDSIKTAPPNGWKEPPVEKQVSW